MSDHNTLLPSNTSTSTNTSISLGLSGLDHETGSSRRHHSTNEGALPSTAPSDSSLGSPVHQYPRPPNDNFELHVQTLLLQALSAVYPSGPSTTFDTSGEFGQVAPTLVDDRQLSPIKFVPVDPALLDEPVNSMDGLSASDGQVKGKGGRIFRKDNDQAKAKSTPKRGVTSKVKPVSPDVAPRRGRSRRSQSPSPTRRERNRSKANKRKTRASHRTTLVMDENSNSDMELCGKFTVSLDTWKDFRYFSIQASPYYPFHPDKHYSNPSGACHRILAIDTNSSGCRHDKVPDTSGKVHVHWYIALNQPAKLGCPLEASPEAWDPRGHRLVPVTDVLEPSSEFHDKAQRDMLVKFYLLMYYRHACQQEGIVNATKVLRRLGVEVSGKRYKPLVLICTFCGQYTDVEWQHVELYDRRALAQEYIASLGCGAKASAVKPMHIGMLSVLTCNHIDCKNASRGGIPPRKLYGGRRDDDDLFCQLYTMKLSEGELQGDMMKIVEAPQEYFPSVLGGNMERLKWQRLGLDDNTVRYLRMEAYVNIVLKHYWTNCRVCGEHVQDAEVTDLSNTSMRNFARKGALCKGSGECTWSEALEISTSQLEAKLGKRWATMLERGRKLRRGGSPLRVTLIQQRYHNSPQSPPLILSDDLDPCTGHGPCSDGDQHPMETDTDEDEPMEEVEVVGDRDMDLDESGAICQIKGAGADAHDEPMEVEEDLWLGLIVQSGLLAPGEVMDWDE